ncbi:DUF1318 domain-containing protein [Geobacter sp.]|uniref:DUF1318 domain-containing protein n=1 Tax=Geobacter sp. TaxID=46610 RepID=UPI002620A577|nr:DUF1318 domain-containing protein [Geobacter sp.]
MTRRVLKWSATGLCGLLAACAIITVNVYFPEKAVKEAYKSLDEMLLKRGEEKPTAEPKPAEEPKGEEAKPQSRLFDQLPRVSLVSEAWAAENYADDLAVELSSMPDVLKAYDEMSSRLPRLRALFDAGAIGVNSQGLIEARDKGKVAPPDEALIKAENASRKVVVTGMAKAILKLNKQKESRAAINQVLPKAAATYAEIKREEAKPGWWVQLQNGRWVQK